jgi:tetratricopeptide (TPR) repeat protein
LVDGTPLTDYCDQNRLSTPERLGLFAQVCQAVHHAHQKGIIHRDLKPSNVLVAVYDGVPVPKVIDFGVAKALHREPGAATLTTGLSFVIGTPLYMSPEQADTGGLDVDTRSDIYSLGVMLYELLTGTTPFDVRRTQRAAYDEIRRIIREEEPPLPSSRISTLGEGAATVSMSRKTEPAQLTKMLRSDLDWIVMKSLEKDRARRYETVNGFAADIQRYLAGEPVLAAPPSARYRILKFVRRHRAALATTAAIVMLILAGAGASTWEAMRAEKNARLANERLNQVAAEKKKAEEQTQIARSVEDFLENKLLRQADVATQVETLVPSDGILAEPNPNPTVHDLLDRAVKELTPEKINSSFPNPAVQAAILQCVGRTYVGLGEYERAIGFLERSAGLYRQHLGPEDPATLTSMNNLADAYTADGKAALVVPLLEQTLKLDQAKLGPDNPITLQSARNLASAYSTLRKLDLARPLFEETLKLCKSTLGPDHPDTLRTMVGLGWAHFYAVKPALAIPYFDEALRLQLAKLGPNHPDTLRTMGYVAAVYMDYTNKTSGYTKKNSDWILPLYQQLMKHRAAILGPEHPDTLKAMFCVAEMYRDYGKLELAVPLYDKALALYKSRLGLDHPNTLICMSGLGDAYRDAGRLDLALPLYEETAKRRKVVLGLGHPDTRISMHSLALAYQDTGKLDLALPLFAETMKVYEAQLTLHLLRLRFMDNFAVAYLDAGKLDKAVPLLEETLKLEKARIGAGNFETFMCMSGLADAYAARGNLDLALPLLEETVKLQSARIGADNAATVQTKGKLGRAYLTTGKWDLALPLFEATAKRCKEKLGPDHVSTLASMNALACAYCAVGKATLALPLFEETLKRRKSTLWVDHPDTLESMSELAEAYRDAGKLDSARPLLAESLERRKATLGPDHPGTLRTLAGIAITDYDAGMTEEAIALVKEVLAKARRSPNGRILQIASAINPAARALAAAPHGNESIRKLALEAARQAVEIAPNIGDYQNTLGIALYRNGDWSGAAAALNRSQRLRLGGDASDWFFLAMAHHQLGIKEDALIDYDKAVAWIAKNAPENRQMLALRKEAAEELGVKEKVDRSEHEQKEPKNKT